MMANAWHEYKTSYDHVFLNFILVRNTGPGPFDSRLHLGPRTGFELHSVL